LPKFQANNGISLNILDYESRIQDEDQHAADDVEGGHDDEEHHDARPGMAIHHSTLAKKTPKDFDLKAFHKLLNSNR
jgi:hypothetical protein